MSKKHVEPKHYTPQHKIRVLTATSLFDGHDAAINIMRRILQSSGAEVIHVGHNRSAEEIVRAAIDEDVQAISVSSYQGGHMEFFKYIYDLLDQKGAAHIKVFGGGGGTIIPEEAKELHQYGISRIYSPEDGRTMGLQGMINHQLEASDFSTLTHLSDKMKAAPSAEHAITLAWRVTQAENMPKDFEHQRSALEKMAKKLQTPVIGLTGTGGAGKSSLLDELMYRFLLKYSDRRVAVLSVDPSRHKTGGALLGDRIRMNSTLSSRIYMRSMATRAARALPTHVEDALLVLKSAGFDMIFFESAGIGQADMDITQYSDTILYVMTPEYGAATQLEKINMLDYADMIAINKSDRKGAEDALRDVKKQYQRNRLLFSTPVEEMPVYMTTASRFNDVGTTQFFEALMRLLEDPKRPAIGEKVGDVSAHYIIPPSRVRYLSEIAEEIRKARTEAEAAVRQAEVTDAFQTALEHLPSDAPKELHEGLKAVLKTQREALGAENEAMIQDFFRYVEQYKSETFTYKVRDKQIKVENFTVSLSGTRLPKVLPPPLRSWGEVLRWCLKEHFPGVFPYTAGIYPFRRNEEMPTRMFAGEGSPEQTNRRFHYLSKDMPFARLSTAFDSVTLYGEDPAERPDIYGKVGNSGVSIATLDDAKKLYSGFDLSDPSTSVSMTINGPASTICAFFMQTAIDQQCERYLQEQGQLEDVQASITEQYRAQDLPLPKYEGTLPQTHNSFGLALLGASGADVLPKETYEKIKASTLSAVRGTVQADILKEDQAQNTCIFSTDFSLQLMGDMQLYFVKYGIRNFYSVSISGYHIAEAGSNPITQLAFTLANGFTYVEYYLARGMKIDDFAPNFSFFFSNGLDVEYAVMGRVARRIWARAMRDKYGAKKRSQQLKYHIQTSGRSLHAQEINFNDIRTTLQALYALYDSCNSLHTNAYDEAITTPTESSVRRALAIQLIINKELGTMQAENILQGSFIIEELTDLLEEAVLMEFDRLTTRGGVLGAMETMYQRSKIQEESFHYETLKHSGQKPIIGVNTFLSDNPEEAAAPPSELIRSSEKEKEQQISNLNHFQRFYKDRSAQQLQELQEQTIKGGNIFEALMNAAPYCSLGQISSVFYEVGGRYRRNM